MRFSDIKSFVEQGLTSMGYEDLPSIAPGPASDVILQKRDAGRMIFIYPGSGASFSTELLFDRPFLIVRTIGYQKDFESAESLAHDLDTLLCKVDSNALIGTAKVLYITRTGGAPTLAERDSANRYHFTCTYITETQTGF